MRQAETIRLKIADSELQLLEAEKKRSVLNELKSSFQKGNLAQTRDDIEEGNSMQPALAYYGDECYIDKSNMSAKGTEG